MKNKIRCLFDKIKSEDLLGIFGICICALLITNMFFAPISASAYSNDFFPRQVTFSNPSNVPFESININLVSGGTWHSETQLGTYTIDTTVGSSIQKLTVTVSDSSVDFGVLGAMSSFDNQNIPNGTYEILFYSLIEAPSLTILTPLYEPDGFIQGVIDDELPCVVILDDGGIGTDFYLAQDPSVDVLACLTVVLVPIDEPPVEPPVDECPTLTDYIEDYSGSWSQFRNAYINPDVNYDLYWGWKNERDDVFATGKLSVTGDFINFNGTYDELLQLLMTTSNNNPNIQAALDRELQRQFDNGLSGGYDNGYSDGKDYGQEVGYKDGYANGLNKGQSDTFTQSFFTDFLGGVVDAIDSIHLYEHIRQIDGGVSTVVEWYISPWTIFTAMTCLIVVIIILKVWLGG